MFGRKKSPDLDPTSIANILVKYGWVTKEQVERALATQQDRLIGQVLIELGYITQAQIDHALLHQAHKRGTVSNAEVAKATLANNMALSDKIIEAAKDIGESAAAMGSGKYVPIKRTT